MTDAKQIQDQLAEPFENVQWRLQQTAPKDAKRPYPPGTRGLFMAYIDARQLYDRLDKVLGFGKWTRTIKAVNADGSVIGTLSICINDEWISHEDIGYPNNPGASHETEPLKAAASDAFKRAGVGLGIGRFLYELDAKWVEIDEWGKPMRNIGVTVHQAAPAPDAPVSAPEAPQEDLPPRARSTTQNPVPATSAPAQAPLDPQAATPRQFRFIQAIVREHGLSDAEVNAETQKLYGRDVSALNRRDASAYIERLTSRRNVTDLAS